MAADVLSTANATPDPVAAAAVEGYAAEISKMGAERTIRGTLEHLSWALHKVGGGPVLTRRPALGRQPARAEPVDLVAVFTELGVTTLTEQQRLKLAQDLIGTITDREPSDRERARARAKGRESILDAFELLDSRAVAGILAPTSAPIRSLAQKRRKAGELIGLPIGARPDYRYPAFQLDSAHHRIDPLVKHANQRIDVGNDPYGAASWWLTPTELLDGHSPLEDLEAGELTEIAIDNILGTARRGM